MPGYTKVNLKEDVEDMAPKFGFAPNVEAHFATRALELEKSGVSYQKIAPDFRMPFGHRHEQQEEVYVLIGGSARLKLEDEVLELTQLDAVRVPANAMRAFEAGPDGAELLAFGAPNTGSGGGDAEMEQGWWGD